MMTIFLYIPQSSQHLATPSQYRYQDIMSKKILSLSYHKQGLKFNINQEYKEQLLFLFMNQHISFGHPQTKILTEGITHYSQTTVSDAGVQKQHISLQSGSQYIMPLTAKPEHLLEIQKYKSEIKDQRQEIDRLKSAHRSLETELRVQETKLINETNQLKSQLSFAGRNLEAQSHNNSNEINRLKKQKQQVKVNLETTLSLQRQEEQTNKKLKGEITVFRKLEAERNQIVRGLEIQCEDFKRQKSRNMEEIQKLKNTVIKGEAEIKLLFEEKKEIENKLEVFKNENLILASGKEDILNEKLGVQKQLAFIRDELNKQRKTLTEQDAKVLEKIQVQKQSLIGKIDHFMIENNSLKIKISEGLRCENERFSHETAVYRERIAKLEMQIQKHRSKTQGNQFDNILKVQLQQSQKFKEIIQSKNDEIHALHNTISQMRSQYQTLSGELDLQKVKVLFQVKNVKSQFEVQILQLNNEISLLKRNIQVLTIKSDSLLAEIKTKDRFIKEYIVDKASGGQDSKEYIYEFFGYYEEMMGRLNQDRQQV